MKIEGLSAEVISTLGVAIDQIEDWQCVVAAAADIQKLPEAARAEHAARLVGALAARATEVEGVAGARTAFNALRSQQRALRRQH